MTINYILSALRVIIVLNLIIRTVVSKRYIGILINLIYFKYCLSISENFVELVNSLLNQKIKFMFVFVIIVRIDFHEIWLIDSHNFEEGYRLC